jgi:two-component system cell cycle sensor histidine kinase PleC
LSIYADQAEAKKVELVADETDAALSLRVNERALRQMLLNLISNALKFTPSGGRVRVGAGLEPEGGIRLRVSDTVVGIPDDKLTEALQPFRQLEAPFTHQYAGTGLGLAIVASLAGHFGARFDLQSTLGEGTTATLYFPSKRTVSEPQTDSGDPQS